MGTANFETCGIWGITSYIVDVEVELQGQYEMYVDLYKEETDEPFLDFEQWKEWFEYDFWYVYEDSIHNTIERMKECDLIDSVERHDRLEYDYYITFKGFEINSVKRITFKSGYYQGVQIVDETFDNYHTVKGFDILDCITEIEEIDTVIEQLNELKRSFDVYKEFIQWVQKNTDYENYEVFAQFSNGETIYTKTKQD